MSKKVSPPTQADVEEATLDAVELVQHLGLPADDGVVRKTAGRKAILLSNISVFLLLVLNIDPNLDGWKRL